MSDLSREPMTTAQSGCLWLLVCCAVAGAAQAGVTVEVSATAEFNVRAAKLQPGDELMVRDGVYADAKSKRVGKSTRSTTHRLDAKTRIEMELPCKGAEGKRIVVRPQTPRGVMLRRAGTELPALALREQAGLLRVVRRGGRPRPSGLVILVALGRFSGRRRVRRRAQFGQLREPSRLRSVR